MQPKSIFVSISTFALFTLCAAPASSAVIQSTKGKTAVIELQGLQVTEGEVLLVRDGDQKKRAYVQVVKIKGDRAAVKVTRGKAESGYEVVKWEGGGGSSAGSSDGGGSGKKSNFAIGANLSYGMDAMKIKSGGKEYETTGSSIGFAVLADMDFTESLGVRAWAGTKPWKTTGPCSTITCSVEISYIDLSALVKFQFIDNAWVGGGMGFLVPTSSSSNILKSGSVSSTAHLPLGGGYDVSVGSTMKVPIAILYDKMLFLSDSDTDASSILVQAGFLYSFKCPAFFENAGQKIERSMT